MGWLGSRRAFSFDPLVRLEWSARRILGQPLSLRAWDRMTFNDKVAYRRLRVRDPVFRTFSDKLAMREYVATHVGPDKLPELLCVGDQPSMFAELEGPYVLKPNHGSGMVTSVDKGGVLSREQLREAESWLAIDYCWVELEWAYVGARQLLLAEEFLHVIAGDPDPPPDYKFFTFDDRVEIIQVDTGRFGEHRRMLRRADWTPIVGTLGDPRSPELVDSSPPPNLDLMLRLASDLGRGLDFVRVDMYDLSDRVLVGELTPYPGAGRFQPESLDAWLGRMWHSRPRRD
jgi:hypothetical protein